MEHKLILAPMAGVTDWAYRTVAAEHGADVTVTEMVSSRALCYGDKKTAGLLKKNEGSICGLQIFGNDPEFMAKAAKMALDISDCDFVDINMGCPMPKVANNGDGSGLMRTPQLAAEIVRAVVEAVTVPVTVKMRKGWDKGSINCVELAQLVEQAGASAIAVHGRTKVQLYTGRADWDAIRAVKQAVKIPVAANGDVASAQDAVRILHYTGADHVMIGRAAFGDPYLFTQARAALNGQPVPERPPLAERFDTAVRQIELSAGDKGEHIACLEARKHLCWYLHGVPHAGYYKQQLAQVSTLEEIYKIARSVKLNLR
jgi:nifR3 family TIM-barrel protein